MDSWDEAKRLLTLVERGLDFADAELVFTGRHYTQQDDRQDYGEPRFITAGFLRGRFTVVTWTPRDGGRRIISMRHGHEREQRRFEEHLG